MLDTQTKERFIELRAQGWSFSRIAAELEVSKPTLITWRKEFELQVHNLKAVELEALHEKHYVQKAKRIELFGAMLENIKSELEKRDLKEMPTDKLFDLLIKYASVLKQEGETMTFRRECNKLLEDPFTQEEAWCA